MPARARKKTPTARSKSKPPAAKPRAKRRPLTPREKMQAYRARMRARGFKLVQVWVPDVNRPGFAEEVRRQSLLVSRTPEDIDAIRVAEGLAEDIEGWT